jgi:hypothetical protein
MISRPPASEYAAHYEEYLATVPEGDILEILAAQNRETLGLLEGIGEAGGGRRYAPGKWSIKQVIGHVSDVERVFAYRALAFARNDATPLPSMEQDDYVRNANFESRTLRSIAGEFAAVRAATLELFANLDGQSLLRRGKAAGNELTVRAIAFVIAGHERHHVDVIQRRYLIRSGSA